MNMNIFLSHYADSNFKYDFVKVYPHLRYNITQTHDIRF